jgi:hypothetical protein
MGKVYVTLQHTDHFDRASGEPVDWQDVVTHEYEVTGPDFTLPGEAIPPEATGRWVRTLIRIEGEDIQRILPPVWTGKTLGSLREIMDTVSKRAQERGLTEDQLPERFDDSDKP